MITAKAPGKLFIAGEYAVVNKGYPAILVAVDRFITVTIESAQDEGSIVSKQYAHLPLKWKRVGQQFIIEKRDNPFHYILEAIHICEEYALALGKMLVIYDLHVDSELDSDEGAKYGLGSSAAVTIACIKALCELYALPDDDLTVYKLACLAHMALGSNGSFGDLAAATMTGWIAYQSFDRQYVLDKKKELGLIELLALDWPDLLILRLPPPSGYTLTIAWTKKPASTASLVDQVKREVEDGEYQSFLKSSKALVQNMIRAFKDQSGELIATYIKENRLLLKDLYPSIETAQLSRLIELASKYGAAKTSGAGGGDCGFVLHPSDINIQQLIMDWQKEDIIQLDLQVYDKEAL